MLFKLVLQNQRSDLIKFLSTVLALAASVAAIVWLTNGYETLFSNRVSNAQSYMGPYDATLVPLGTAMDVYKVPDRLSEDLRSRAFIKNVHAVQQSRVSVSVGKVLGTSIDRLIRERAPVFGAPPIDPYLIATESPVPPFPISAGSWLDGQSVVLSENAADNLGVSVGDSVIITADKKQTNWRVGGIVEPPADFPSIRAVGLLSTNSVYVTPRQSEEILGQPFHPSHLQIAFAEGVDSTTGVEELSTLIEANRARMKAIGEADVLAGLAESRSLGERRGSAWSVATFAALASFVVIGAVMNANVRSRSKELAMLRAIGWTRGQVALSLIIETLLLATIGWMLGLLIGNLLLACFLPRQLQTSLSWWPGSTTLTSSLCSLALGGLAASVIPIWRACSLSPMDAISSVGTESKGRLWIPILTVLSILFLGAGWIMTQSIIESMPQKMAWFKWLAYPCYMAGIACLIPLAMILLSRSLGRAIAKLLSVDATLFVQEIQARLPMWTWLAMALSVGLSLLLATQIWGNSILQTFVPGKWMPDGIVALNLSPEDSRRLAPRLWEELKNTEAIQPASITPIYVEQTRILAAPKEPGERPANENAVVIGLPTNRALQGDTPLLPIEWLEGDKDAAIEKLLNSNGCIVSEDFLIKSGLSIGDMIQFAIPSLETLDAPPTRRGPGGPPREARSPTANLEIVASVRMTGWHWLTKFTGLRKRYVRTSALIFADKDSVRDQFQLSAPEFCWFDMKDPTNHSVAEQLDKDIQRLAANLAKELNIEGVVADPASESNDLAPNAETTIEGSVPWTRFTATLWLDDSVRIRAKEVLWAMCYFPLLTMLLFTIAIACSLASIVKTRSWQYGIIRSLGFSRSYLIRWVVGEALFLAIVTSVSSIAFGLIAGWGGLAMARHEGFFAGPAPWVIPPLEVSIGLFAAIALSLASILIPAWYVGTKRPMDLLRERSSSPT